MKTVLSLIEDVFLREGDAYAEPPAIDQPTGRGGITLPALQAFYDSMQLNREAQVDDLRRLTHDQAVAVVQWLLEQKSKEMGLMSVSYDPLRLQLLDFGYNSGPELAIRWLQRVLAVPRSGKLDPVTVTTLQHENGRMVHQALISARMQMIQGFTEDEAHKERKQWELGLGHRAMAFSLLQVP